MLARLLKISNQSEKKKSKDAKKQMNPEQRLGRRSCHEQDGRDKRSGGGCVSRRGLSWVAGADQVYVVRRKAKINGREPKTPGTKKAKAWSGVVFAYSSCNVVGSCRRKVIKLCVVFPHSSCLLCGGIGLCHHAGEVPDDVARDLVPKQRASVDLGG